MSQSEKLPATSEIFDEELKPERFSVSLPPAS
jgi:hypothetical protein